MTSDYNTVNYNTLVIKPLVRYICQTLVNQNLPLLEYYLKLIGANIQNAINWVE